MLSHITIDWHVVHADLRYFFSIRLGSHGHLGICDLVRTSSSRLDCRVPFITSGVI